MRLFLLLALFPFVFGSHAATLRGQVTGGSAGEALIGAVVVVQGTSFSGAVDAAGHYEIRNVPAGSYAVQASFVGYREAVKSVVLAADATVDLDFALQVQAQSLSGVTVMGKMNQEEENASRLSEKTADNIVNIISSRAIERSPDINAANVLTRVSGINIQRSAGSDGAYAVIRGMEPRYNNTLVNGIKIPSPDSRNRFVPLDIIPSDLLKRIEVIKSLVPSMEGDATGGTVNLVMKDAPDTTILRATASIGYSQIFFDRKYESFPQADIQPQSPSGRHGDQYVATQQDFSRSNLKSVSRQALPTYLAGLTFGHRYLNNRLGLLVALNTQNQYYGSDGEFNTVATDPQNQPYLVTIEAPRSFSNHQENSGLVTHLDFSINARNKLAFDNLVLRSNFSQLQSAVDTSLTDQRRGPGTGTIHRILQTHTTRQVLENAKLSGRHELASRLLFDWAGVVSVATSNTPDFATLDTDFLLSPTVDHTINRSAEYVNSSLHLWQHNRDRDYTGLANLAYQTTLLDHALELKVGGMYRAKDRYNTQDEYDLRGAQNADGTKQVFTGIDNAQFDVYTPLGTAEADAANYTATENIGAGYAQAKWELGPLQVLTGVRLETTQQGFTTRQISTVSTLPTALTVSYQDILPSLNLRYTLNERQNLRFSYFGSVNRPNYYELVPYRDYRTLTVGNPHLLHATADNLDLRYEIYPTPEDYFTVGVFYKHIVNAIESRYESFTAAQIFRQPQNNAAPVTNIGAEATFTKYIQHFGLSGNYTYTHSALTDKKVFNDATTGSTYTVSQVRPLQSQADHIVNLSLLFRDKPTGFYAQLSYQYTGRILQLVNANFDYYQRPLSSLALSVDKDITRHFTAFAKLNNLLNTKTTLTVSQSDLVLQQEAFKATYLLGVRYAL